MVRIAYLDCATGISGDMTLGALIDLGVDQDKICVAIDSLGLPGVVLHVETTKRCGFRGTHIRVEHPEQHAHRHLHHIRKIIQEATGLTPRQRELALQIFQAVGEAEARVHGSTLEKIHFHEVGAIDSIVDIVGAAVGFDLLGADLIISSPVPTGRGSVKIEHGVCAVPTPGTAELLKGIPLADVPVDAELTTPTGAAILATLVHRFGPLPEMTMERIGYGAGTKDFPDRANLLRIIVGEATQPAARDQVVLLETNLDDVTGEVIGYAKQKLMEAGALDVFSTAIQMKKDRPGVLLSVLCALSTVGRMEEILFAETGTFGIRRHLLERSVRNRKTVHVKTRWGTVHGKLGWIGEGKPIFTPEFKDCAKIAEAHGIRLREVYREAEQNFSPPNTAGNPPAAATPSPDSERKESPSAHHSHDHDHDHDH